MRESNLHKNVFVYLWNCLKYNELSLNIEVWSSQNDRKKSEFTKKRVSLRRERRVCAEKDEFAQRKMSLHRERWVCTDKGSCVDSIKHVILSQLRQVFLLDVMRSADCELVMGSIDKNRYQYSINTLAKVSIVSILRYLSENPHHELHIHKLVTYFNVFQLADFEFFEIFVFWHLPRFYSVFGYFILDFFLAFFVTIPVTIPSIDT